MDVPKPIVHVEVVTRIDEAPVDSNPASAVPAVIIRTTPVPVPISIQPRSDNEPGTETDQTTGVWGISPEDFGIVLRNINDLRLRGFDLNVIRFDDDLLFRSALKNSGLFSLFPQTLDRPFHVLWLRDIGLPK
jgi:hypothetical protein